VLPERKTIRLDHSKYLGRNIYFLTFCCEGRSRVFENEDWASWIVQTIRKEATGEAAHLKVAPTKAEFLVHAYCVMPDHVHVVVEGARDQSDMGKFVKAFKQVTAFYYKQETGERLWQKKYYDHILRGADTLDAVMWYVWLNPVRAGLCADARSYAYSGSFALDWNSAIRDAKEWVPPWKEAGHQDTERPK
jgi:REP element-mobilizing transposase RayT